MTFCLRLANPADLPVLTALIDASVRGLQAGDYTPSQIDGALDTVYGVDTQLVADQTYFAVEHDGVVVACGGWSKRKTLYGGDHCAFAREDSLLDPAQDAAKIRAFFVHPDWVRRGLGTLLLKRCEEEAAAAGFSRLEMGSTLTGVALYQVKGYSEVERISVPLANGEALPVVRMAKNIGPKNIGQEIPDGEKGRRHEVATP